MKCEHIESRGELRSALQRRLSDTVSTLSGCHLCNLKTVTVPGCESKVNQRPKRAIDNAVEVLFSLVVINDNSSSSEDNVEEKSEAVLFQMQYAVSTGQFMISLHGINTTAQRSSLERLFSKVTCSVGSVPSKDGKRCGEYLVVSLFVYLFVYLFIYLFIYLFMYLFILFILLFFYFLFHLFIYLFIFIYFISFISLIY